ncbi:hypothetical protein THRCLA_02334 [Thraustotheca clavata]|uniref:Protein kinase domain-containing protein n=1 Tax=Thraustotheca clavata TaxID=74557 RepID=A0A1W0A6A1_9STRA|nr:hypothetical protein THRCLA_02334 [Thraustotheca clavata]
MSGLTLGAPHNIPQDTHGEYFDGTYEGRPALLYLLNERGVRYLPRVQTEVWNRRQPPNILCPITVESVNGRTIVVYPLMLYTLQEYLRRVNGQEPVHAPLNRNLVALNIAIAMVEFVGHDGNGLLHRNLSSKTIFVSPEGLFVVGGLFSSRDYDNVMTANVSADPWTAPEILSGHRDYDWACDVYSYGIILSELDTLRLPYTDKDAYIRRNLGVQIVNDDMRPSLSDDCDGWYEDLVVNCVAANLGDRPCFVDIVTELQSH